MAHALYGYDGPCKNIHGHSYKLEVCITGEPLNDSGHPKNGMVMDFSDLKKIVSEKIIDRFDHAFVLNADSPHSNIGDLKNHFEKIIYANYQPSCENLLIDIKNILELRLPGKVKLFRVRLSETETSFAEWFADDLH